MRPYPKVEHTEADLRSPEARRALAGVDVLWHLGFQLWRRGTTPIGMADANLGGTRNVVACDPARIVFASSAAVYGAWPDNPLPIPETHPPRPNREVAYAAHKLTAEGMCADAAPTVALRIGAVLGPRADPLVRKGIAAYRRVVPAVRGVRQALQFLHEDDAAAALHRAGTSDVIGVVNVATDDWLSETQIAAVAGGRVVRVPRRVAVPLSEAAYRVHLFDAGADRAVLLDGPLALDCTRAHDELGWRARQGSAEVLREFLGL